MSIVEGYSFPKSARLTSNKSISALYEQGRRKGFKPLRYVLHSHSAQEQGETRRVKVLVSVPKKLFKHAVDRNKLKRRIRESYRLVYHRLEALAASHDVYLSLGIMYSFDQEVEFNKIADAMEQIISNIEKGFQES